MSFKDFLDQCKLIYVKDYDNGKERMTKLSNRLKEMFKDDNFVIAVKFNSNQDCYNPELTNCFRNYLRDNRAKFLSCKDDSYDQYTLILLNINDVNIVYYLYLIDLFCNYSSQNTAIFASKDKCYFYNITTRSFTDIDDYQISRLSEYLGNISLRNIRNFPLGQLKRFLNDKVIDFEYNLIEL